MLITKVSLAAASTLDRLEYGSIIGQLLAYRLFIGNKTLNVSN